MSRVFEFDPEKSAANLAKHGIDFEMAQALWLDPSAAKIPALSATEDRFGVVGCIDGQPWTAFATMRDEIVRIISVRRSRQSEVRFYDTQKD